jgi:hypothetical protein
VIDDRRRPASTRPTRYTFWPTPTHERLIDAALFGGPEACAAFEDWSARVVFDDIDTASQRLLPLVCHNLAAAGFSGSPLMGRLRGVRRQHSYRNQLLLGFVADLLGAFARAGIPTLLLKGIPLALLHYPTPATRPMTDGDILIPEDAASAALDIVRRAGLRLEDPRSEWPPRWIASTGFVHSDGWHVDLHTRVMHECWQPRADDALWRAAVPMTVNGVPTRTLTREDHLVHVLAHGARPSEVAPIRWIVDAAMLVRSASPFDWTRVVALARERRLSLIVRTTLTYAKTRFRLAVPSVVLEELGRDRPTLGERFELRSRGTVGRTGFVAGVLADYVRRRGRTDDWRGPLGFVRYVRDYWHLDSAWQVPAEMGRWTVRHLQRVPAAPRAGGPSGRLCEREGFQRDGEHFADRADDVEGQA